MGNIRLANSWTLASCFTLILSLPFGAGACVRNGHRAIDREEPRVGSGQLYAGSCGPLVEVRLELRTCGEYAYTSIAPNFVSRARGTYKRRGRLVFLKPEREIDQWRSKVPARLTGHGSLLLPCTGEESLADPSVGTWCELLPVDPDVKGPR